MREDEMAGWHHQLNGQEFAQTPGISEGQGSLVCCSPWISKSWTQLKGWITTTLSGGLTPLPLNIKLGMVAAEPSTWKNEIYPPS